MRSGTGLWLAAWILVSWAIAPVHATEPNILVIRAGSLDAVSNDIVTLAAAFGEPLDPDEALAPLIAPLGVDSVDWVDRSRPLAVIYPTQGIALGLGGFVAVLPARADLQPLAALAGAGVEPDEQGVVTIEREGGNLVAAMREGYVVIGKHRHLVLAVDTAAVLSPSDLPAGSVAADVFLEPLAPLIQVGLGSARAMFAAREAGVAHEEKEEQAGENEPVAPGERQQAGEHGQADAEPEEAPDVGGLEAFDAATMGPMMELYFGLVEDIVNNSRKLQLSLELTPGALIGHLRLVPRAGSTLEGLVREQSGGLPTLARHLDPEGALIAMAGQIAYTPEFLEAMQDFIDGYLTATEGLFATLEDTGGAGASWFEGLGGWLPEVAETWSACYRGDFAWSFGFDDEGAARSAQLFGAADPETCRTLVAEFARRLGGLPGTPDGETAMTVTENAWTYGDVHAMRTEVSLPPALAEDPELQLFRTWFGDSLVQYVGTLDELMIATGGKHADQSFRDLVDRARAGSGEGLTASMFAPIPEGPGVFGFFDVAALFEMLPAEDDPDLASLQQALAGIPAQASRLTFGMRFDGAAVNFELALPERLLALIGELADDAEEPAPAPPEHQAAIAEPSGGA